MSIFVLVHGAFLGRFCWNLLVPELSRLGHSAISFDLPIDRPDLGAEAYAKATVDEIARQVSVQSKVQSKVQGPADSSLILVGHSMGGLVIPLVADEVEVQGLVYLAAALPKPGASFMERARGQESDVFLTEGEVNPFHNRTLADKYWFHDCSWTTASWAKAQMRAQNSARVIFEESPIKALPAVAACSIVGAEERLLSPAWSRRMSKELLGVDAIDVQAGHCPQVSQPVKVAHILHEFAASLSASKPSSVKSGGRERGYATVDDV